jgi:DNA-binding GntR family transcriptional regulator
VRHTLPNLDQDALDRIVLAAKDCVEAAEVGDMAAELAANRRFHFGIFESPEQPHALRLIRLLWESTEGLPRVVLQLARRTAGVGHAHDRILAAVRARDADELVAELDAHRERALDVLRELLAGPADRQSRARRSAPAACRAQMMSALRRFLLCPIAAPASGGHGEAR